MMSNKDYEQTLTEFLDFQFESSDLGTTTVRGYYKSLLSTLWNEGEGFSGKRPFGNSGWDGDLYKAAALFDKKYGTIDEDGYLQNSSKNAFKLIEDAIEML